MATLSISQAWDETKARIAADGRLMTVVAAALIALPALVTGVISPGTSRVEASLTEGVVILIASLIAIIGQLAIIHMAIGTSVSVGEAIGHGARRMPVYFVTGILIAIGLLVAAIPFVAILMAAGVPLERTSDPAFLQSPVTIVAGLLYFALVCFIAVRMMMTSPVASEETVGPIGIIRRSWELTRGNWWRLFGFIILFLLGAVIAITAINWAVGFLAITLLGPVEPMSASALLIAVADAIMNAIMTVILAVMLARIYLQLSGRESADVSVPKSGT
jgi:hypothetical protein